MELRMTTTPLQVKNVYPIVCNWHVYTQFVTQTNNGDVMVVWCAYFSFKTTEQNLTKLGLAVNAKLDCDMLNVTFCSPAGGYWHCRQTDLLSLQGTKAKNWWEGIYVYVMQLKWTKTVQTGRFCFQAFSVQCWGLLPCEVYRQFLCIARGCYRVRCIDSFCALLGVVTVWGV
jgi:hypothetical protein